MDRSRTLQALLWALKPLQGLHNSIPLPCAIAFLLIAFDEGKSMSAYARDLGVSRTTMFRYLRFIGERTRNGSPGLKLVRVDPHPTHSRKTKVHLSTRGRSIADAMLKNLLTD